MTVCWVLAEHVGMMNQALGLAENLPVTVVEKHARLRWFWRIFSPYIILGHSRALTPETNCLKGPWPDVIISCGRRSVLPALAIQKKAEEEQKSLNIHGKHTSKGKPFKKVHLIHIQDPLARHNAFDAIVCPDHDGLKGDNVITTIGATHRVSPQKIALEHENFHPLWAHLPKPWICVLLGGPSKAYAMDEGFVDRLVPQLKNIQQKTQGSLLITPSRRTPDFVIRGLKDNIKEHSYIWDQQSANPYFAMLHSGDVILVTCDSVCMISEACATDKPVFLLSMEGGGNKKFHHFHNTLLNMKRIQWFKEDLIALDMEPCIPLDENKRVAQEILKRISL